MWIGVVVASLFLNALAALLIVRASRRLLEFDYIWEQAMPVLFGYADDLRKMVSTELLTDNPEVVAFHKRNLRTITELDSITKAVGRQRIEKKKLPRPDVE